MCVCVCVCISVCVLMYHHEQMSSFDMNVPSCLCECLILMSDDAAPLHSALPTQQGVMQLIPNATCHSVLPVAKQQYAWFPSPSLLLSLSLSLSLSLKFKFKRSRFGMTIPFYSTAKVFGIHSIHWKGKGGGEQRQFNK